MKEKMRTSPAALSYPIKREIWGVVFLLLTLIFGVSLLSYHPQDPLFWEKAGAKLAAENLFGTIGAHLAGALFMLIGFSAFWLILMLLYLSISFFSGKFRSGPTGISISLVLIVLSFSILLSLHMPRGVPYHGAMMGGGLIGSHGAQYAKRVLNSFGAYALFVTIFLISFMFITRFSFGRLFGVIWSVLSAIVIYFKEKGHKFIERRKRAKVRKGAVDKIDKVKKRKMAIIEAPSQLKVPKPTQEFFPFMATPGAFKLPPLDLLDEIPKSTDTAVQKESLKMNALRLEGKLRDFAVEGEVVEIVPGPVITMYEFKPAPGVKISKVASLADDLALNLRASSIRIVAPIPGKSAIGIEIPNNKRRLVTLKEILSSQPFIDSPYRLTVALGTDIIGQPVVTDLTKMPHLLVAGATGTGKSVSINAMINSILFKASPEMVRFIMIDPKRIELAPYQDIPHLLHPVVNSSKEATKALRWAVQEMERRYSLLSDRGVRNIEAYNRKIKRDALPAAPDGEKKTDTHLPYIVIIIDELADLMMVSSREVEESLTRLAQMARAAGIHLILATQRPSVDVLTGIIKANFPTRISFQVSSRVDSRTILDGMGAEHLLGDGDMLFLPPGVAKLMRIHGAFVSEEEVKRVTTFLREQMKPDYDTSIVADMSVEEEAEEAGGDQDEKYQDAVELVLQTGQASISMVQRKLRVGYNRAARMIEAMEKDGIVGPSDGVRPREVLRRRERF